MCKGSNTSTQTQTQPNSQAMSLYSSLLNQAQGVAATPYQAYTGQLVAPVNDQQTAGIGTINGAQGIYNNAYGIMQNAAQPLTAEQIQQYQSPYTQAVVDATQRQFNNQNAQARQQLLGQAAAQGALGGNRIGVAEAQLANQQQLAQAPTIANLYNQSYQSGLSAAQQQQQAMMQGAQGIAGIGQGTIGLGGAQIGAGSLQQQTQQAQNEAAYQQWQNQQAYPYQNIQWLANLATGVGSNMGGTSSTTPPQPNKYNQVVGGIGTAIGLAGMFGLQRGGAVRGYAPGGGVMPEGVVPEGFEDLLAQQEQLRAGDRDVQMFPRGTEELPMPPGMDRIATERGAFHFNPARQSALGVAEASSQGRENELLDLGPYSKADIMERIQRGEQPIALVERTPEGLEVRAAIGTESTLPEQLQVMEQAKSPGNIIKLEDVNSVLKNRSGGEETPVGLAAGGTAGGVAGKRPAQLPWATAGGYVPPAEFGMVKGSGAPKPPSLPKEEGNQNKLGNLGGLASMFSGNGGTGGTYEPGWGNTAAFPDPGANSYYSMGGYQVPVFGVPGMSHGGAVGIAGLDPAILQDVYGIGGGAKPTPGFDNGGAVDEVPYTPDFNFNEQFPQQYWSPQADAPATGIAPGAAEYWPEAQTVPSGNEVSLPRVKPQMYENPYKRLAQAEAEKYGIPKDIAFGLLEQESAWNPDAVSRAGARGIAQFMPATARGVGLDDSHDPMQAIPASMKHLRDLYNQYGDWNTALAGYNASPRAVNAWREGRAPLPLETQNYISSIRNMANIKPGFKDDTPVKPATMARGLAPASQEEAEVRPFERASYAPDEGGGVQPVAGRNTDVSSAGVPRLGQAPAREQGSSYDPNYQFHQPQLISDKPDWSAKSNLWPSLVAAGLGMMASRSPHLGVAIGEGGQSGLGTYAQMREAQQNRAMTQQRVNLEAMRLRQSADIEARRAREAEWPYSRMTVEQQKRLALEKARLEAQERQQNFSLRTPFNFTDSAGRPHVFRNVPSPDGKGIEQQEYDPKTKQWVPTTTAPYTGGFNEPNNNNPPPPTSQAPNGATPARAQPVAMTEERALAAAAPQEIRAQMPAASKAARNDAYLEYLAQDRGGVEGAKYAQLIKGIADYQINPNALFSLRGNARQRALEDVLMYDPTYQQHRYNAVNRAVSGWPQSPEGRATRSLSVTVEHLMSLEDLSKALNNGDTQMLNQLRNTIKTQFGYEGPPNFEFAKRIVADEIAKAVIGGQTAQGDREGLQAQIKASSSPEQLAGVIKTAKELMAGQLVGLRQIYQTATGLNNYEDFLTPNAREEVGTLMGERERKLEERRRAKELGAAGGKPAVPGTPVAPSNKRVIQNGYIYEQQADGAWKPVGKAP